MPAGNPASRSRAASSLLRLEDHGEAEVRGWDHAAGLGSWDQRAGIGAMRPGWAPGRLGCAVPASKGSIGNASIGNAPLGNASPGTISERDFLIDDGHRDGLVRGAGDG